MASGTIKQGVKIVQLWSNPNPTSAFPAQTVAVDYTPYDLICILSWINSAGRPVMTTQIAANGNYIDGWSYLDGIARKRGAQIVQTGVQFSSGVDNGSPSTAVFLPQRIYGIKL